MTHVMVGRRGEDGEAEVSCDLVTINFYTPASTTKI
jgi:hypothetical protein